MDVRQREMEQRREGRREKKLQRYLLSNLIRSSINHYNHPVYLHTKVFGSLPEDKINRRLSKVKH